jgi:2-polyprenyl-3-methyl-5-hydroxy-6-metoxy-1,4-benzoquinol methylase
MRNRELDVRTRHRFSPPYSSMSASIQWAVRVEKLFCLRSLGTTSITRAKHSFAEIETMHQSIQAFYDRKYVDGAEISRTSKTYAVDCVPAGVSLDILDVGCGSGENSAALAAKGHRLHGVDLSQAAIEKYRRRGFDGCVCDIESGLDFPNASFDAVFCSEVIEHMTSPEILAAEMSRVLKPGGLLVLSTPNSAFWLYRVLGLLGYTVSELQHPKHFQFFSRRSLLKLLTSSKLKPKQVMGRNMYLILPDMPGPLQGALRKLGFARERRFRTGGHFWHLSHRSSLLNTFFADCLIVVMEKE